MKLLLRMKDINSDYLTRISLGYNHGFEIRRRGFESYLLRKNAHIRSKNITNQAKCTIIVDERLWAA
jgi:hypothetical protein